MTAWSDIQEKGYEFVDETDFNELVTNDKNIAERVAVQENLYSLSAVPLGTICMWYGTYAALVALEGWQLCDGTNGLPDLRGCFVMGAEEDADIGVAGGLESHYHAHGTGVTGSGGAHGHSSLTYATGIPNYTAAVEAVENGATPTNHTHNIVTPSFGSVAAHTHVVYDTGTTDSLPPYRKLYWIGRV
jgi:hypothetical protein